jgi:hypothetical protein
MLPGTFYRRSLNLADAPDGHQTSVYSHSRIRWLGHPEHTNRVSKGGEYGRRYRGAEGCEDG